MDHDSSSTVEVSQVSSKSILASYGKTFYWASFFLGREKGERAAQLYRFCRYLDDLADGNDPDRLAKLMMIKTHLTNDNDNINDPHLGNFLQLMRSCNIPREAAIGLVDGMVHDQHIISTNSRAELLHYSYSVAGTVGLMMCRVLGCSKKEANYFAIDLGIAMQLTNISRDVLEDASMERRYIPLEWVNLSAKEILQAEIPTHEPVAEAIKKTLDLADKYYTSALKGIQLLPFRARLSIVIALLVYREIGNKIRRTDYNWWRGRVFVSVYKKLALTLLSIRYIFPSKNTPQHDSSLHDDLEGFFSANSNGS